MPDFSLTNLFSPEVIQNTVTPWLLDSGAKALRILLIVALAAVVSRIVARVFQSVIKRVVAESKDGDQLAMLERRKRTDTLSSVAARAAAITIWGIAIVMALSEVGFNVGPLLTGAGVAGVAIGFGAQHLVGDFLGGFFMLIENQIRVGDVAEVNGKGGLVEQLNLRTTVLRDLQGIVHVFPNGKIETISNLTRDFSYWVFELGVAYKENVDRVINILFELGDELRKDKDFSPKILNDIEVFGLDKFGDSALIIKGRIKTMPLQQWSVGRELNRRIKNRFDQEGIEIPFPHRTLYFGQAQEAEEVLKELENKRRPQSPKEETGGEG